jgi:hypothetical protein
MKFVVQFSVINCNVETIFCDKCINTKYKLKVKVNVFAVLVDGHKKVFIFFNSRVFCLF